MAIVIEEQTFTSQVSSYILDDRHVPPPILWYAAIVVFALVSYFDVVFSFILISTDNYFPYCEMALSIVPVQ